MMKNLFFLLLLIPIVLASCSSGNPNAEKNIALIEKFVSAVEENDFNVMESILADNYFGVGPSVNDSTNKSLAVERWRFNVENLYEKIEYEQSKNIAVTIDSGQGKGEWVSTWAVLNITYKNDRGTVKLLTNTIYQIENDKIVKSSTFYNEADVLEQLGYVFINLGEL